MATLGRPPIPKKTAIRLRINMTPGLSRKERVDAAAMLMDLAKKVRTGKVVTGQNFTAALHYY